MRYRAWGLLVAIVLPAVCAAALGESVQSIEADRRVLKASLRVITDARFGPPRYSVHEVQTPEGTLVREYVDLSGLVFAVSWQGHFMPNLQQTLGSYFEPWQSAVRQLRKGRSPVSVVTPTLIVQSGGRSRAFFGLAYLPQQLPADISVSDLN